MMVLSPSTSVVRLMRIAANASLLKTDTAHREIQEVAHAHDMVELRLCSPLTISSQKRQGLAVL